MNANHYRVEKALAKLNQERQWIKEHGGDLVGYVARYGSADDPERYGDGGEAIYKADADALARAQAEYDAAIRAAEKAVQKA